MSLLRMEKKITRDYLKYVCKRTQILGHRLGYIEKPPVISPILQNYFFCNVWRDADRFSVAEITELHRGGGEKLLRTKLKKIAFGRYVLSPATNEFFRKNPNATVEEVRAFWARCKAGGVEFVGGAISMYPQLREDRAICVHRHWNEVRGTRGDAFVQMYKDDRTPQYLLSKTCQLFTGIGMFRAYEMFTSATYIAELGRHEDELCHMGPGSPDGLTELIGRKMVGSEMEAVMYDLTDEVKAALKADKRMWWLPMEHQGNVGNGDKHKFTVRTMEDTLCEFRKYRSIVKGGGRKRKYTPKEG